MLLKLLFFIILFLLITRFVRRLFLPFTSRNEQFNPFKGTNKPRRKNFDQIEDADYEDLSDKN